LYDTGYRIARHESDGALLGEILSGASKKGVTFRPEDLDLLFADDGRALIENRKLVGCNSP